MILKKLLGFIALFAITISIITPAAMVYAQPVPRDYAAEALERKFMPVESNQTPEWPKGPSISAKAAVLMEANTGTILYAKNIHEKLFPASTTKIMTALLAMENCGMDEIVTMSRAAASCYNYREDSNAGLGIGEQLTMEQMLYCVLVGSANEAAYAVGEHIAGDMETFTDMMNQRAKDLGCTETNFVNANGLHNEDHYTSAHDLGLIAAEFFKNDLLCKIASTAEYEIPPTDKQPDYIVLHNKNKMLPGKSNSYEYFIGGKTGFTSVSRQTLVSGASNNGMRLACVILMEESPGQFLDTIELFEYGFANFERVNIADNETKYSMNSSNFYYSEKSVFGDLSPILSMSPDNYVLLPNGTDFAKLESYIDYDAKTGENEVAAVTYTFNGVTVGRGAILYAKDLQTMADVDFSDGISKEGGVIDDVADVSSDSVISDNSGDIKFINIAHVLAWIGGVFGTLIALSIFTAYLRAKRFERRRNRRYRERKPPAPPRSNVRFYPSPLKRFFRRLSGISHNRGYGLSVSAKKRRRRRMKNYALRHKGTKRL